MVKIIGYIGSAIKLKEIMKFKEFGDDDFNKIVSK
jgi:hypothetical protein